MNIWKWISCQSGLECLLHMCLLRFILELLKHWIAFFRCSRAIWIASERKANWMHRVSGAWNIKKRLLLRCVNLLFFPMQCIWPVNTDKMRCNTYIYIALQQSLSRYCLITVTQTCHISQISNEQKVRHLEQPVSDGWRTEQSRRVIQCK